MCEAIVKLLVKFGFYALFCFQVTGQTERQTDRRTDKTHSAV